LQKVSLPHVNPPWRDPPSYLFVSAEIWDQLHAFKADDTKEELVFPQSLSNKERNLIHQAAEGLGLSHVSKGEGSERHVVVTKKKKHGEGEKEKGKEEGKEKNAKSAKKPYAVCSPPFKGEDGRMVIQFYRERDLPFGCFSNFSRHPILIDGKKWWVSLIPDIPLPTLD